MINEDERRRSAELLKDLIVDRKRARWPWVLGVAFALLAGGAAYWRNLPPAERPTLSDMRVRLASMIHSLMNAPILGPSAAPASPAANPPANSASPADNDHLLSK